MVMAGVGGFEPPTAGFGDRCSTKLSYAPIIGTPGGTRTPDARLRTPPLYPTELQGQIGGDRGIRTLDLGIANAALSQLSYIP